ncbi:MAG: ABC transporter substrate-binding protein [Gemmatimonadetes bacterium]|nr:ABC transporter substrate-binding protein [Gemmatimonadota bacterium]
MSVQRSASWIAAACVAMMTAACGRGEPPTTGAVSTSAFCDSVNAHVKAWLARAEAEHPVPDDPRYGGTVVVGTPSDLGGGLNPAITGEYIASQYQQFVLYMTLVRMDDRSRPMPYLARSWELNADSTELTFHLRDDVYWHDGVRTDAHDVAFTYQVDADPETHFPNAAYWDDYAKGDSAVTVVDDSTVRFRLRPHADFLDPWRATPILPEHLLKDVPHSEIGQHPIGSQCPVGNGPFTFVEHQPADHWTFGANPAFPTELGGRPYIDRLVERIIPDQNTLLAELRSGGIDVYVRVQPDQIPQIEADSALRVESFTNRWVDFVAWNSRRPQLADPRVRRALAMAVDRREIIRAVLKGYGTVATTTVAPYHWAYDSIAVPPLPYDPKGARALLEEAGWVDQNGDGVRENADGVKLSISIKSPAGFRLRQAVLEIIQAQLKDVGVEVRPEFVDPGTLTETLTSSERPFDGVLMSWISDFKLDDRDLFLSSRIDGPFAFSGTRNAQMDRLLDTLQLVVNRVRAKPLWVEYARLQREEQPYLFLYYETGLVGMRRALRGAEMDARGEWVNVRRWWLDPAARQR